jgi:hypothetical protein
MADLGTGYGQQRAIPTLGPSPTAGPAIDPALARVLQQLEMVGIDWGAPGAGATPRPAGPPAGQQFAAPAYNPIADVLARHGVQSNGPWQDLARWAAPAVNRVEGFARGVPGVALEMTGLPAAGRAGEALAAGNVPQAAGQAMMALPSRLAAIPGIVLSEASAQQPDPRLRTIRDLEADIARREKILEGYATRNFQSTRARTDASAPHLSAISDARIRIKAINDEMAQERRDAEAARRAEESAATARRQSETDAETWRNTPLQQRYPGLLPTTIGSGLGLGMTVGGLYGGMRVRNYNARINDLNERWGDAVSRANNTRLGQARRQQAIDEARALQTEFEALAGRHPFSSWTPALTAAGGAELGAGGPAIANYALGIPGSADVFMDPMTYARLAGVGLPSAAFGKLMGTGIDAFTAHPTGYSAATEALPQRAPPAPRRRRRN